IDILEVVLARAANGDRAQARGGLWASRFQDLIHYGSRGISRRVGRAISPAPRRKAGIARRSSTSSERRKNGRRIPVLSRAHQRLIVVERDRPARRVADFDAGADSAAPAGFARGVERHAGQETGVLVAGHGGTALHVPEDVVPGVANLAREEADCIDLGLVD